MITFIFGTLIIGLSWIATIRTPQSVGDLHINSNANLALNLIILSGWITGFTMVMISLL